MTDSRKNRGIGFWLTVVATIAALYVASSGPGNWLALKGYSPNGVGLFVYAPLLWIVERCPEGTQQTFGRWLALWHPSDWDEKMREEIGEALVKEMFKGMTDDFAPLLAAEDEEMDDEPSPAEEAAGRVFSVATNEGMLVVTVNDPETRVQVFKDEGKIEITGESGTSPVTISVDPAEHSLKVEHHQSIFWAMAFESEPRSRHGISAKLVALESERAGVKTHSSGTKPGY